MRIIEMSYTDFILKLVKIFKKYKVEYMIVGGASAVIQVFNHTTQDVDIFLQKKEENIENTIKALKSLGFKLSPKELESIIKAKDFIQLNAPYELDLMFATDGFENYEQALEYKIEKEGIPLMSIEGIIKSKQSANRPKDKAVLPMLKDFLTFLRSKRELLDSESLFTVPRGFKIADVQTINRWVINETRPVVINLRRGTR